MVFEDDRDAIKHLRARGYVLTRRWDWVQPADIEEPSEDDLAAANYLFEEWDMGYIVRPGADG
jgi:hypothetical protein